MEYRAYNYIQNKDTPKPRYVRKRYSVSTCLAAASHINLHIKYHRNKIRILYIK